MEEGEIPPEFARPFVRMGAWLVDAMTLTYMGMVIGLAFVKLPLLSFISYWWAYPIAFAAYPALIRLAFGATAGEAAFSIRVVRKNGASLGFVHGWARLFVGLASSYLLPFATFMALGAALAANTPEPNRGAWLAALVICVVLVWPVTLTAWTAVQLAMAGNGSHRTLVDYVFGTKVVSLVRGSQSPVPALAAAAAVPPVPRPSAAIPAPTARLARTGERFLATLIDLGALWFAAQLLVGWRQALEWWPWLLLTGALIETALGLMGKASPGKLAIGLSVVTRSGEPLSPGAILIRALARWLSPLGVFCAAWLWQAVPQLLRGEAVSNVAGAYAYFWMLLAPLVFIVLVDADSQRRALHDRFAGTLLLRGAQRTPPIQGDAGREPV